MEELIATAGEKIRQARSVVALTGAGVSTPSGIPDFRSAASGLWDRVDPSVATIQAFRRRPEQFFSWVRPLAARILDAAPNPAHLALSALETQGALAAIITQNIDNLHHAAGSRQVIEIHGHLRQATCQSCAAVVDALGALREFVEHGTIPICRRCHGVLKPNVILFGETLPMKSYAQALAALEACDLMLVAGCSLVVAPVNDFPMVVRARGAQVIIVNNEPTYADALADIVLRGDVADILPRLSAAVGHAPG